MIIIPNMLTVLHFIVRTQNLKTVFFDQEHNLKYVLMCIYIHVCVSYGGFLDLISLSCCIYKNAHRNIANKTFSIQTF